MEPSDLFLSPALDTGEVETFLRGYGFREPARADQSLQEIAQLVGQPRRLAELAQNLLEQSSRSVDPDAAIRNFSAFLERSSSPATLVTNLFENPSLLASCIGILGASPYLTQSLLRNPEYFYWLADPGRLQSVPDSTYFRGKAEEVTRPFDDAPSALEALRRYRRRESLRIGAQDLLGEVRVQDTVQQISDLADAVLHQACLLLSRERLHEPKGFAVIGLGKLGGRELNFSSDVDLLFVFSDDAPHDPMLRFARAYLKALGEFTGEGHLFRVDLRLRPMGKTGEIAYSESATRQYYQTWADTTDRLALIKCRYVAGDQDLGHRFVSSVQDFVFKKYLDYAAVEEIRWIKKRTDDSLRRRNQDAGHIKLGLGGIREIEFFVQAFQILYGGTNSLLRCGSTLPALDKLLDFGIVSDGDYRTLREAYLFLRDVEHKLQLVHDLQTHSLPEDDQEMLRCAKRMGYRLNKGQSTDSELLDLFKSDLKTTTLSVHKIYLSLFEESSESRDLEELVLNPALPREEAVGRLQQRGFHEADAILDGIQILAEAPSYPYSPSRLRNLLANLVPQLAEETSYSADPRKTLGAFDRFCEALGARAPLYSSMMENPAFARRLLTIFSLGEVFSETLVQNPELLDVAANPQEPVDFHEAFGAFLGDRLAEGSSAQDAIRLYKRREQFKIAMLELDSPGNPDNRIHLSQLAETCIGAAWDVTLEGAPDFASEPCGLFALGKLGGRELVFHSDLDLVFVVDDQRTARPPSDFFPLLKVFRNQLVEYTSAGRAYSLDFRLRPEGRHAGEIVLLTRLREYFESRIEAWERLAYVKLRPVLVQHFEPDLNDLIYAREFDEQDRRELRHMRTRKELEIGQEEKSEHFDFKVGRGGLLDVQFLAQYLQLKHNIRISNLLSILDKLESEPTELSPADCSALRESVLFYFALESAHDLVGQREVGKLSRDPSKNRLIARILSLESPESLLEKYQEISDRTRRIYEKLFG